jgi:hypothetical protein
MKPIQRSAVNENWNFGACEHFAAGTRFAQAGNILPLQHLCLANN